MPTILIVDDDFSVARLQKLRLESAGYDVCLAETSVAAMAQASQGHVDLAIIDLQLGGDVSGLELIEQFQAAGFAFPVIIVTGHSEEAAVIHALRIGVSDFVPKTRAYLDYLPDAVAKVLKQKHTEEQLAESEAKFRSVSESAIDAIIATDQYGNVVSWNGAATSMFGYSEMEMQGQSLERIVPVRFRASYQAAFSRMLADGESAIARHPLELSALHHDGTEFPIELSVGHWHQGGHLFLSGIVRDVTDRMRAAEELQKRDEQLRHSQRLEALGTLAGGVAHEFNNLLQSIQGYTHYAREGLEPEDPRRQDLDLVLKAAERAAGLTRQLLGFSRRQVLQFADLDANQVVQEAASLLRPLIGEHIHLEISLGDEIGTVHADSIHLQQLLMNLAINARDAMPQGGQLLIKTENVCITELCSINYPGLAPGDYLALTVSDTGCGMPPEVLEHAFDPFFTTKDIGQGTGLGLASVYGVVTQHRGTVRVYSEPGMGTSFKVLLPTVKRTVVSGRPARTMPRARDNETILVAEDEPLVRDLTIRTLESAGYRTLCASDGSQALQIFRDCQSQINLVMLDVVMPRMTGHDVYRQLRQLDPAVKVIFSSAYDLETAQLGFIGNHGLRFVAKPCEPATLLQTIRAVLDAELHAAETPSEMACTS